MGSLSLRPGDSLTVPRTALSVGFIRFVSSTNATQATGFRLFPRWDSPPTEHASLSLVAPCSKKRSGSPLHPALSVSESYGTQTHARALSNRTAYRLTFGENELIRGYETGCQRGVKRVS